jgi:hypothetical protein
LLTGMTGISLHMQWPLASQSHGSVSQREQKDVFKKPEFRGGPLGPRTEERCPRMRRSGGRGPEIPDSAGHSPGEEFPYRAVDAV